MLISSENFMCLYVFKLMVILCVI